MGRWFESSTGSHETKRAPAMGLVLFHHFRAGREPAKLARRRMRVGISSRRMRQREIHSSPMKLRPRPKARQPRPEPCFGLSHVSHERVREFALLDRVIPNPRRCVKGRVTSRSHRDDTVSARGNRRINHLRACGGDINSVFGHRCYDAGVSAHPQLRRPRRQPRRHRRKTRAGRLRPFDCGRYCAGTRKEQVAYDAWESTSD